MSSSNLFIITAILITISLVLSGCNVTSADDHDEHHEPWGLILLDGDSEEIARQFEGEITYTSGEHLKVEEGEESSRITLHFLDEEGDTFTPHDDEYFLAWVIEQENIIEIERHEEDGKWNFRFVGVGPGETRIRFLLNHGDEGHDHADFESQPFDIHVEGTP